MGFETSSSGARTIVKRSKCHWRLEPRQQLQLTTMGFLPLSIQVEECSELAATWRASVVVMQRKAPALVALQLEGDPCCRSRDAQRRKSFGCCGVQLEILQRRSEMRCEAPHRLIVDFGLIDVRLGENVRLARRKPHGKPVLPQSTVCAQL